MGSKKSTASSSTSTTTQDNSAVAGNNAVALAAGASYQDWYMSSDTYDVSDRSTNTSTSNSNNSWSDNSRTSWTDNTSWTDQSVNLLDNSDRSVTATDSRSWYALDNSDRSVSDSRSWYALDNSDRSVTATDDRSWYSYASDERDMSTVLTDSRNLSTVLNDSSNRSVSNYTGTDPGVLQFAAQAGQLLGAINESQTDGVAFMTQAGADLVRRMGESATSLYATAGSNNLEAWTTTQAANERLLSGTADRLGAVWADTLDKSAGLIGTITQRAANTADATIAAYQPPEAQQATTTRYAMLAVAGLAAVLILPRLMKA